MGKIRSQARARCSASFWRNTREILLLITSPFDRGWCCAALSLLGLPVLLALTGFAIFPFCCSSASSRLRSRSLRYGAHSPRKKPKARSRSDSCGRHRARAAAGATGMVRSLCTLASKGNKRFPGLLQVESLVGRKLPLDLPRIWPSYHKLSAYPPCVTF